MQVKTTQLPNNYSRIDAEHPDGYTLTKKVNNTMYIAFCNKQFGIYKELDFVLAEKQLFRLVFNPNNANLIACFELDKPLIIMDSDKQVIKQLDVACESAIFDTHNRLFVAEKFKVGEMTISVYDENFDLIDTVNQEDEMGYSCVDYEYNADLDQLFLTLAAGQDGCMNYSLSVEEGKIKLEKFNEDASFVCTNNNQTRFLTIMFDYREMHYYSYPEKELLSNFEWGKVEEFDFEWGKVEEFEDAELNFILIHLVDDQYLIFFDGRARLFNALEAKIEKEIVFEGYPPMPIQHFFPRLKDEGTMTDIFMSARFGDIIGFSTTAGEGFYVNIADLLAVC